MFALIRFFVELALLLRGPQDLPVSAALLGLLAFGSHNEQRFLQGMGTDYLTRLGEIVSETLEVVLEPGF